MIFCEPQRHKGRKAFSSKLCVLCVFVVKKMPYSDFKTLDDILTNFDVTITSGESLFAAAPEAALSLTLSNTLDMTVPLALNINTEKARSELIIAPLLLEVWQQFHRKISLFSGIDFSVDERRHLNGFCDFLLSSSPDQAFLEAPVICVVEAKNENIKSGYAQCIAEMIAAQLYNAQKSHPVPRILGVVTTGSNWKFLTLEQMNVKIDYDEYLIAHAPKIVGILLDAIRRIGRVPRIHAEMRDDDGMRE